VKLPFDFANKLLLRLVLPGALLTATVWPVLLAVLHWVHVAAPDAVIVPIAILIFGWVILLLDMPIYMIAEGRRYWPNWLRTWGVARESARLRGLTAARAA